MKIINIAGLIAAAVAAVATGSPAAGADLGSPYGGSMKDGRGYVAPQQMGSTGGPCYFRSDVGYSGSRAPGSASWPVTTETRDYANPSNSSNGYTSTYTYAGDSITDTSMTNTWFGGVGLGCGNTASGIRGEVMLNQTGTRNFEGTPLNYSVTNINGGPGSNTNFVDPIHASIKSTTLMFNGYKDLGTYGRITPYLGAGVGVAYNKMGDVSFTGNPFLTNTIQGDSRLSLAWSLMAGIGYQVSDRATLDVGYRFMDYGRAQSGVVDSSGYGGNPIVRINDITAHEVKVGLRYNFGGADTAQYQPMK